MIDTDVISEYNDKTIEDMNDNIMKEIEKNNVYLKEISSADLESRSWMQRKHI